MSILRIHKKLKNRYSENKLDRIERKKSKRPFVKKLTYPIMPELISHIRHNFMRRVK